jgi:hypothetical protein
MTVHNREIAELLSRLADLLEIDGPDRFRVRAYRHAAQSVAGLSETLAERVGEGEDPTELPSIGESMAAKIATIVETGELPQLEELEERLPADLSEMMKLSGLGPKRVKALHQDLGVETLEDLKRAVDEHRVREVKGLGSKIEAKIGERLAAWQGEEPRTRLLEDGSIDLPDDVLERLDLRVCSVHYKLDLPREKQTERILRAMDSPHFNILAHPTGRLIGERGCFLGLNAQPRRLDLNDADCRLAESLGVKVAISTDAHTTAGLDYMRFGVGQARRGWLEADDVINTRSVDDLRKLLAR